MKKPSADLLNEIAREISASSPECVLIGGMAVDFYRAVFKIESSIQSLTGDLDYFGGRVAIDEAAEGLGSSGEDIKTFIATIEDQTPNSGKIAVYRSGFEPVEIDFLYRVDNIDSDEIESRALTFDVNGTSIRVVNPALLMEMKIGNLAFWPSKRNRAGIEQARLSVEILKAHLEALIDSPQFSRRRLLDAVERVLRFAARDAACFARMLYGVDVLAVVSPKITEACGVDFSGKRWPVATRYILDRQARFERMIGRIRERGQQPEAMRF